MARWWSPSIVFHPHKASILATLGQQDTIVRVWHLDLTKLLHSSSPAPAPVHYTTAKIALVGDSGIGKTGLGQFIATGKYLPTESTHGQQFWVVDKLVTTREGGTKIALPMISPRIEMSQENYSAVVLDQTITGMCTTYETALVRVKGLISNKQGAKKLRGENVGDRS